MLSSHVGEDDKCYSYIFVSDRGDRRYFSFWTCRFCVKKNLFPFPTATANLHVITMRPACLLAQRINYAVNRKNRANDKNPRNLNCFIIHAANHSPRIPYITKYWWRSVWRGYSLGRATGRSWVQAPAAILAWLGNKYLLKSLMMSTLHSASVLDKPPWV